MIRIPGAALYLTITYIVGIWGLTSTTGSLYQLFLFLTPFHLLLTCILLLAHHRTNLGLDSWWMLATIILGYGVEVVGVNTGLIFGQYQYGTTLGLQLFHTPLIIGINWLLLAYTCTDLMQRLSTHFLPKIAIAPLAAALATGIDYLIEPVAIRLNFWHWIEGAIPIQNYIGWFGTGTVYVY